MRTIFMLFLLLCTMVIRAQEQQAVKNAIAADPDRFYLIDRWMEAQKDYDRLPGVAVAVVRDQEVVWSKGFGYADAEKRTPMTPQTLFSICSISKLFTAVAIMQLVEEGRLRLDDSIQAVLPRYSLKQQYPDSGPVTIRSLLTHSSGLPRESDFPYWTAPDFIFPTREQMYARLDSQTTLYPASTYYQYSNLALSLLGEIVTHISGMPYEQYVQQRILEPLRLRETRTSMPRQLWGNKLAIGYGSIRRDGSREKMPLFDAKGITAAAGFSSNVEDLARFASWQFRLLEKGGKEILKAATLRDMQRVQFLDPNWKSAYGLGFSVRQHRDVTIVGHGGSCPGYLSNLMIDTKNKIAVVVMVNGQGQSLSKYSNGIYDIMRKKEAPGKKTAPDLKPYTGTYENYSFGSELLCFPWQGKLAMIDLRTSNPSESLTRLEHIEGDRFRKIREDDTLGDEILFVRNPDGTVRHLVSFSNHYRKIGN